MREKKRKKIMHKGKNRPYVSSFFFFLCFSLLFLLHLSVPKILYPPCSLLFHLLNIHFFFLFTNQTSYSSYSYSSLLTRKINVIPTIILVDNSYYISKPALCIVLLFLWELFVICYWWNCHFHWIKWIFVGFLVTLGPKF